MRALVINGLKRQLPTPVIVINFGFETPIREHVLFG